MPNNEKEKFSGMLRSSGGYLTLGIQLAVTVVVFFFIGKYLDEKFGTTPWLMVIAIVFGSIGGLIKFFHTVMELTKQENEQK